MHHCDIDDQLHGHGLKKTHPRHRIIELFRTPQLWSVRMLKQQLHDVGQSTIYRTVHLLLSEGVITQTSTHNGEEAFELTRDHHDHLACSNCHTTSCLPCPIPSLQQHTLELKGVCASCSE